MNYQTEENRKSLARWQERKAAGGIKPGDDFHWAPYPYDWRDKNGDVRFRCAICNRVGSNDKMQMVEVVLGGEVRCWDEAVIATLSQKTQDDYARATLPNGKWSDMNDAGYMGWWFVGSECAKHIDPSLFPPKEIQDKVRSNRYEYLKQRAEEEKKSLAA